MVSSWCQEFFTHCKMREAQLILQADAQPARFMRYNRGDMSANDETLRKEEGGENRNDGGVSSHARTRLDADYSNSERFKLLASGAVYDLQAGHIVANPGGGVHAITTEKSQDMHRKRRELQLMSARAFRVGMARQAGSTLHDALGKIAGVQYELATDKGAKRASTEAAKFLLDAGGLSSRHSSGSPAVSDGVTVHLGADVAARLLALVAGRGKDGG